jgi:hypothetical protein
MADRVLFIGWNRPVIGREKQAVESLTKSMQFYGKLQADGRIESFDTVILSAHGGDMNGFVMLKGSAQQIAGIRQDETFIDLTIEAGYCVEGLGVVDGFIGDGLTNVMSRYMKLIS